MTNLDDITRDIALGRLSNTHLTALVQRIQRLEQVLRDVYPEYHALDCSFSIVGGKCDCECSMIDDVLSEGL